MNVNDKKKKKNMMRNVNQMERISFLHRISHTLSLDPKYETLSRGHLRNMHLISKKIMISLDRTIKRQTCKQCFRLLTVGLNAKVRIENESKKKNVWNDVIVFKCVGCKKKKRFPIGKSHLKNANIE